MSELLKRIMGGAGYFDEAGDGTEGSAGGGEAVVDTPAAGTDAATPAVPASPIEEGMLAAIKEKIPAMGTTIEGEATRVDDGRARNPDGTFAKGAAPAAAPAKGAVAPGAQPAVKKPGEVDPAAKDDPAKKTRKAADLDLPPEVKKTLSAQANQRFRETLEYAKEQETLVAQHVQRVTQLQEANTQMLGLFEEHHVTPDDLSALLTHHKMVRSGNLEGALRSIETQRTAILRALGREAPGVDLLEEFPDLHQRVKDQLITREDAVALANARRTTQAHNSAAGRARAQSTATQTVKARQDAALASIDAWAVEISQSDIDYAGKEAKLLPQLKEITSEYPPELWLPTFKRLYGSMVAQAAPAAGQPGNPQPLRPNGARGGAKQPADMTEAIRQGLGYPT